MNQSSTNAQIDALKNALLCLLRILNDNNVVYALLHPGDDTLPDVSSDIDIILATEPKDSIEPALSNLADEIGTIWTQSFHYDVPYGYYYVVQVPCDNGYAYLQLDCLCDPIGINRYHLSSKQLLKDRTYDSAFYRTSSTSEALYLAIKRSLKGNATQSNIATLSKYIVEHSTELTPLLVDWFGKRLTSKILDLCKFEQLSDFADLLNNASAAIENRFLLHHPIKYLISRITNTMRQITRFFKPTGLFVVLIGPDGCGKTTISTKLRCNMERCFRNIWRFHWRPKLLPKLGRNKPQNTEQSIVEQGVLAPPEKSKYNGLVSLIRFTYYLADFIIGYWLIIYPKKARSTLIVGERYFADILVHPARYGFLLPNWLLRISAYLVPKPDAIVLLYGDPQKIHDRKPELPVETISKQIDKYFSEMTYWGENIAINSTDSTPEQATHDIEKHLGRLLESRISTTQLSNEPNEPRFIYPPIGRPRILINKNINKSHIEALYNPGGRLGRFFTFILYNSPSCIRRILTRSSKSKYLGLFPVANSSQIIKQHLELPNASLSYYLGNGGPRSKITAQIVNNGEIVGYVKIAGTPETHRLICNESEALKNMSCDLSISAPKNNGLLSVGNWKYLFQTCPNNFHPLNSDKITKEIESLANRIFNSDIQKMSFDRYLEISLLEDRVNSIPEFEDISCDKYVIKTALEILKSHFSVKSIIAGRCHGDFCAWNIIEGIDKELFIYDWEYSEYPSPALSDLIHFTRARYHFIDKNTPERLIERLFIELTTKDSIFNIHALRFDINTADIPYYAIMYFIRQVLRHAETGDGSEQLLRESPSQIEQINYLSSCLHALCSAIKHGSPLKRILVSAYACESDQGSEPGVGWNWVKLIGKNNHIWVITRKNNRESIEKYLYSNPNPNLNFVYVDLPKMLSFWKKRQRGVRTYYYLWQFAALIAAKKLHKKIAFDLGHHVTFVNDWLWSFLALMPIPYIWGPIGSHPKVPSGLLPHRRAWFKELLKLSIQRSMRVLDPLYWITAIRAKRIIAINNETKKLFPLNLLNHKKFVVESAIAYESKMVQCAEKRSNSILYVGRFHHTKCPHLVIQAFSRSLKKLKNAELIMVGRGPEEASLKDLADSLGSTDAIMFVPWCSQADVFHLMSTSTLFLFPSTEGGGMVVIEAMAHGLPVVCLNYGGPGVMVPDACGYKAAITSKENIIDDLSEAIVNYYLNNDKLNSASKAAKEHAVSNLSWDRKADRISMVYDELLLSSDL